MAVISPLGDEIAELLAAAPRGMSCDALSARLQRRRTDVRLALVTDTRFQRRGSGRGSRWVANATAEASRTGRDGNLRHGAVVPPPDPSDAEGAL